jgi:hypothetical protein
MSQNSLILPTTGTLSGLQLVNDANNALDTLNTKFSGNSAPASPETGQDWMNVTSNPYPLQLYDGAQWVADALLDSVNHVIRPQYVPFYKSAAKSANYTVAATDHGSTLSMTGAHTFTLPAGSGLWDGFLVTLQNLDTTGGTVPLVTTVATSGGNGIYIPNANAAVSTLYLNNTGNGVTLQWNGAASAWVAVAFNSQVAFSAAITASQTLTNATAAKIQLASKNKDVGGYFDATTNYRFTPLLPGLYFFAGFVGLGSEVNGTAYQIYIYKNGTSYVGQATGVASGTGAQGEGCSGMAYMNGSSDYVELWAQQNSGGSLSVGITNQVTQLSGCRLA